MSLSLYDVWSELLKSKSGIIGLSIIALLLLLSLLAFIFIPFDRFKEWNNNSYWLEYPRSAMPIWINIFLDKKLPEHVILKPSINVTNNSNLKIITHTYKLDYKADDFPVDFILKYEGRFTTNSLLQLIVVRPDGSDMELGRITIQPNGNTIITIFSNDDIIKNSLINYKDRFNVPINIDQPTSVIFADKNGNVLKGEYRFKVNLYLLNDKDEVLDSKFILGGKVYGLFGTDELRRDLAIGLIWGAPIALFIGISVAVLSVVIGLIYGVIAGYKGGNVDEILMRANDIVYSLPALPLLILLSLFVGKSVFLTIGYLIIFGWIGIAKVSRSMALQIRNMQYIEVAELIGLSSIKIVFKHIIPQLLPYTFASIAISVPSAIITEAGLSFLGLGDPNLPTWGQILHDANVYGAAARGLWWWILPPGLMIALTGLAFVLIGNTLDKIVNPTRR